MPFRLNIHGNMEWVDPPAGAPDEPELVAVDWAQAFQPRPINPEALEEVEIPPQPVQDFGLRPRPERLPDGNINPFGGVPPLPRELLNKLYGMELEAKQPKRKKKEPIVHELTFRGHAVTIGADIEGGLYHHRLGMNIPATLVNTPGEKGNAVPLKCGGSYHRDNIGVEYQTIPATNFTEFVENSRAPLHELKQMYSERLNSAYRLHPVVTYHDPAMLELPEAMEMGCDPDFCAYDGAEHKGPSATDMKQQRCFSGHIHIGSEAFKTMTVPEVHEFVKLLDRFVGLVSAQVDFARADQVWVRRKFYGQAGRFRFKPYGIEYRTPSNTWVSNSERRIWNGLGMAMEAFELGIPSGKLFQDKSLRDNIDMVRYAKKADDGVLDYDSQALERDRLAETLHLVNKRFKNMKEAMNV